MLLKNKNKEKSRACRSVVKNLPSVCEVLSSIPSTLLPKDTFVSHCHSFLCLHTYLSDLLIQLVHAIRKKTGISVTFLLL